MSKLSFFHGDHLAKRVAIAGKRIYIVDEENRTAFEIVIEGQSISVRGVETRKAGDIIHTSALVVRPQVSNVVNISQDIYP